MSTLQSKLDELSGDGKSVVHLIKPNIGYYIDSPDYNINFKGTFIRGYDTNDQYYFKIVDGPITIQCLDTEVAEIVWDDNDKYNQHYNIILKPNEQ